MSDGTAAATAAPPATTTPTAPTTTPKPAKGAKVPASPPPEAAKPAEPAAWGEADEKDLLERFKRSPYGKRKVNGKEEPVDDLKAWHLDAMRGRGATKLVEETKKESAAAKAAREEAESLAELVRRARAGDKAARRELALIPDDEAEAQRQQFEALPPEVQAVIRRNAELEQERAERLRADEETKASEAKKKAALERKTLLDEARKAAKEILADVDEANYDVELPHILSAMRELKERKLRLNVDYTAADLKTLVEDHRVRAIDGKLGNLKPEALLKRVVPALKGLSAEQLQALLGGELAPLGRRISEAYLAMHRAKKQASAKQPAATPTKRDEAPAPVKPLSPFRF